MASGNSANLPAPYLGVAQDIPQAALKSPNCYSLLNFNTTSEGIALRNGDTTFFKTSLGGGGYLGKIFGQYGDTSLFVLMNDFNTSTVKVYNVETGTLAYTTAAAGAGTFRSQFFNKNLFYFCPDAAYSPGIKFNGTTWAVVTYVNKATGTTSGLALNGGGTPYKNRNYIVQKDEAAYWYSEIDAISGDLTKVDLSGLVNQNTTLSNITKITLSDQINTVEYLVFSMANGEILFFSGAYPDSDSWGVVGRAKIGQLVSFVNSVFPYQGDAIILSDSGIASLRDLFLKGSQSALNLSLNTRVQKTWRAIIKLARAAANKPAGFLSDSIQGIWDEANSRFYILLPYTYTPYSTASFVATGNFFFVFDAIRGSWSFHRSGQAADQLPIISLAYYKNKVIYVVDNNSIIVTMQKEGSTGFTDRDVNDTTNKIYDFIMITAPIPFPKTAVYEADQIEPIIESDLYSLTNWNFVCDFGRQTSGDQPTDAITTSVAKPAVNVGMQNITFVQVKMSGVTAASKTVGLTLYSFNVWYDAGQKGSR